MMNYIITAFAIAGLFIVTKKPWLSFFVWTGTNLYWCIYAARVSDTPQMIMFAAFTLSCGIQFWRTA